MRFPAVEIVDLYSHRWEIEVGYQEIRSSLLNNEFTLKASTKMIEQELWGVLLGYNIIRYPMANMAKTIPGIHPNQLSFTTSASDNPCDIWFLVGSGRHYRNVSIIYSMKHIAVLPLKEDRIYPRCVKPKSKKYPNKKKASQLN